MRTISGLLYDLIIAGILCVFWDLAKSMFKKIMEKELPSPIFPYQ